MLPTVKQVFVTMRQMITRNIDFPNWLQDQMDARDWRPTDLAKKAHVSDATVSRVLKGQRDADIDTLMGFAEAFNMSPISIIKTAFVFPDSENENKEVKWEDWKHLISQMNPQDEANMKRMASVTIESRQKEEKSARASKFKDAKTKK
jgi:transcriptional regulator with XRE-family HTH domain